MTSLLAFTCNAAQAGDDSLWLTSGLRSWHTNQDQRKYRENNDGIGLSYEMPYDVNMVAGTFMNSDNRRSNYFGASYQPVDILGVRLGVMGALFSGYTSANFEATLIPMASYEYKRVGVNLFWVPSKVTGLQLKFKLADV